jgi:CsoR family transcriptional regulator, copper-sensing transcriptional repressor
MTVIDGNLYERNSPMTSKEEAGSIVKTDEACHQVDHGSYQENKKKILDGLRRVEGQVRGIQRMVDEERYCVDVLNQIAAVRMAMARLAMLILEDHTKGCVSTAIVEKESAESTIEELMDVIKRLL